MGLQAHMANIKFESISSGGTHYPVYGIGGHIFLYRSKQARNRNRNSKQNFLKS